MEDADPGGVCHVSGAVDHGVDLGGDAVTHPMNTMILGEEEYFTPPWIFGHLSMDGIKFDLDPCTSKDRPWDIAELNLDYPFCDGLKAKWWGRVWLNPPYGRKTGIWIKKLADHGQGIALIPARTDTAFFQDQIFQRAQAILFIKGRVSFCNVKGEEYPHNSGAPSCLVAYGRRDADLLKRCWIDGKYILL